MKEQPHKQKKRAVWTAALLILLGGIVMFGLFGCGRQEYTVDYRGQKDDYADARDTYKAGEKVKLTYTMIGTDTDYSFYLDDEPLNPRYDRKKGCFILQFTMPEHDVQLECRAVNSMIRSEDEGLTGDMLVDYYTETVATDGGDGSLEMVLYTYTSDQLRLVVYRRDDPEAGENETTYVVPRAALDRCYEAIDEAGMRTWNDSAEPLDGEEGAVTVVKFRDAGGSYVRVTSEAMPNDGAQTFARIREILASYVSDTYRK